VQLPLFEFTDISLLLFIGAVILLITDELSSAYYGPTVIIINKKRLHTAALTISLLFLITMAMDIIGIIIGS
jgi:hypothetical protein